MKSSTWNRNCRICKGPISSRKFGIREKSGDKITSRTRDSGGLIYAVNNAAGVNEVLAEVGDVLKEERLVAKGNVVENQEGLVEMAHVTKMQHQGHLHQTKRNARIHEFHGCRFPQKP